LVCAFFANSDLDTEAVEVGNRITVDLYLGGIKNGKEKITDDTAAASETIISGLRHLYRNRMRFDESKSKPSPVFSAIVRCCLFVGTAKVEIYLKEGGSQIGVRQVGVSKHGIATWLIPII